MAYRTGNYSREEHMSKLFDEAARPGYNVVPMYMASARDSGTDRLVLWQGTRKVAIMYENRFEPDRANEEERDFLKQLYHRLIGVDFDV